MKIIIFPFIFLSLLGVFFFSLLVHEGVHIFQMKEASSISYDFQQKTFMHVTPVSCSENSERCYTDEEFLAFKPRTEKTAEIISYMVMIILSFVLGIIVKGLWEEYV